MPVTKITKNLSLSQLCSDDIRRDIDRVLDAARLYWVASVAGGPAHLFLDGGTDCGTACGFFDESWLDRHHAYELRKLEGLDRCEECVSVVEEIMRDAVSKCGRRHTYELSEADFKEVATVVTKEEFEQAFKKRTGDGCFPEPARTKVLIAATMLVARRTFPSSGQA
ncbi:MAG: hypothetical protein ACRED0_02870 [Gammaproteobacteria bacterium]